MAKRSASLSAIGFQSTPPVAGGRCPSPPMVTESIWMFQSTPPVAGGRCCQRSACRQLLPCFNPRPPLPGGDATSWASSAALDTCFNPRPPLPGGDAPSGPLRVCLITCFNPRPPLPGGDAFPSRKTHRGMEGFNPRPPLPGGDAGSSRTTTPSMTSFNPRPPLPGGDAQAGPYRLRRRDVSIHAPRCRGAMHVFMSRNAPVSEFQSTPPVAGGRCQQRPGGDGGQCHGFNPRPPLPGGDAPRIYDQMPSKPVSIHAPRCRGAMHRQAVSLVGVQ